VCGEQCGSSDNSTQLEPLQDTIKTCEANAALFRTPMTRAELGAASATLASTFSLFQEFGWKDSFEIIV
jgi:hypothetical protein